MSNLHISDHKALIRAGFTEREISTQQRKFYNLTQISPLYTDELKQLDRLVEERRALLDALHHIAAYPGVQPFERSACSMRDFARNMIASVTGGDV